ncbi:MAG: hypothetical protein GOV02_02510 [Candidatus Aenigmarchaeota archaeon]|nr:hypothetical protein [Candidatus Aenigmarchaeota archaeon]
MAKCSYCSVEFPDDKFGFKMEIYEGDTKKIALFCKKCGLRMKEELKRKTQQVRKEKEKL